MAEIRNIDLGQILGSAETIKGQRLTNTAREQQNRLDAILNPMKAEQAQREIDMQAALQEGQIFLNTLGDVSQLPEQEQQAAWANARETLRRYGSDDVDEIPELYDPQALQGIQGLVSASLGKERSRVGSQEILADGTVIQSTPQGPKVFSPSGELLQGQAAVEQVRNARQFEVENQQAIYGGRRAGTLGADIELGGQAEGAKAGGKFDVEESRKAGLESFQGARGIRSKIALYDEAINLIDKGANTGAIASRFPNLTSTAKELENVQRRLGLNIIQTTTFGALSESEMLLALETGLPTGMDEAELKQWLIDKKAAEAKAAEALENAAAELLSGNMTLADLAKEQASKQSGAGRFKIEVIE